jgi:Flp pilus assembly protein TadD
VYALLVEHAFRPGTTLEFLGVAESAWLRDPGLEFLRGQALARTGQYADALLTLEPLAKPMGPDPELHGILAELYDRLAMDDKAKAARKIAESGLAE